MIKGNKLTSRTEKEIRGLLKDVDIGATEKEIGNKLIEFALIPDFFEHLDLIPEYIERLKAAAKNAWSHPEDVDIFYLHHPKPTGERLRNMHIREYWTHKALRDYFYPDKPLPEFEVIKYLGEVKDTYMYEDSLVIFVNDINHFLIKGHPVICVKPDEAKVVTKDKGFGWFKREQDALSEDYNTRIYGTPGIILGPEFRKLEDLPIGSKLYIDREDHKEIPPKPEFKYYHTKID